VDWIYLAVNSGWCGNFVNRVMNAGNFLSFLRQSAACVSVTGLKVLILAVCRYANACGYCMGR
jgi:hypothetical protein